MRAESTEQSVSALHRTASWLVTQHLLVEGEGDGEGEGQVRTEAAGLLFELKKKTEEASWKAFSQLFAILASSGEWNAWGTQHTCTHMSTHTHSQ